MWIRCCTQAIIGVINAKPNLISPSSVIACPAAALWPPRCRSTGVAPARRRARKNSQDGAPLASTCQSDSKITVSGIEGSSDGVPSESRSPTAIWGGGGSRLNIREPVAGGCISLYVEILYTAWKWQGLANHECRRGSMREEFRRTACYNISWQQCHIVRIAVHCEAVVLCVPH